MKEKLQISASIVLYKEGLGTLQKTINCFLETPLQKKLFLVDNSPTDILKKEFTHPEIIYIFMGGNSGFGKGHNVVIEKLRKQSAYHLVLNPDVFFQPQVIPNLIQKLENDVALSMISPKVVYPNGDLQYTCRKYPTVLGMLFRRAGVFKRVVQKREYRNLDLSKSFYPDFIHGCFLLFKTDDFIEVNGFDPRYFLYMEDADICKKIDEINKLKMYDPSETVEHIHRKGSAKKIKLFYNHLVSAYKYFKKWGF